MDFLLITILILTIIGIGLIFFFIKKVLVAIALAFFLLIVVLGFVALFTYLDVVSFQEHKTEQNLLVFHADDHILLAASFPFDQKGDAPAEERVTVIPPDSLAYARLTDTSDPIQETYYKIIMINTSVSEDLFADVVEFSLPGSEEAVVNITKEEALYVLESEDALTTALDIIGDRAVSSGQVTEEEVVLLKDDVRDDLALQGIDSDRIKVVIGGLFFMHGARGDTVAFIKDILSSYHADEIRVYEKTMVFRLLDLAPLSVLEGVIEGVAQHVPVPTQGEREDVAVSQEG